MALPLTASAQAGATPAQINNVGQLRTAYYFGNGNPVNFWSTDTSGAATAFRTMAHNGFNSVGFVIPWGYFQPSLTPPEENKTAFARLDHLIQLAQKAGLVVVLRLSYEFDVDPADQMPWHLRQESAYHGSKTYNAWLAYISALHANVSRYSNIAVAYISWEDYWDPVADSSNTTDPTARVRLAQRLGYQAWLSHHFKLSQVSFAYGQNFTAWSQVPTPLRTQPSFSLMFSFDDAMLVNRFFYPAQARFPGLTIEARPEQDVIENNGVAQSWYTHSPQYQLNGAPFTGIYYSPYMNDPSTAHKESAAQADWSLATTLGKFQSQIGGRSILIHEFEFVSNAPQVAAAPQLAPNQVNQFLVDSGPRLAQQSHGYGLWTYRNFNFSPLFNPSFALGMKGWKTSGKVRAQHYASGVSYVSMLGGSSISQQVQPKRLTFTGPVIHVAFDATAKVKASLTINLSGHKAVVGIGTKWHSYTFNFRPSDLGHGDLKLVAHKVALRINSVQLYGFTQTGDVYKTSGRPDFALSGLRRMNQEMAAAG